MENPKITLPSNLPARDLLGRNLTSEGTNKHTIVAAPSPVGRISRNKKRKEKYKKEQRDIQQRSVSEANSSSSPKSERDEKLRQDILTKLISLKEDHNSFIEQVESFSTSNSELREKAQKLPREDRIVALQMINDNLMHSEDIKMDLLSKQARIDNLLTDPVAEIPSNHHEVITKLQTNIEVSTDNFNNFVQVFQPVQLAVEAYFTHAPSTSSTVVRSSRTQQLRKKATKQPTETDLKITQFKREIQQILTEFNTKVDKITKSLAVYNNFFLAEEEEENEIQNVSKILSICHKSYFHQLTYFSNILTIRRDSIDFKTKLLSEVYDPFIKKRLINNISSVIEETKKFARSFIHWLMGWEKKIKQAFMKNVPLQDDKALSELFGSIAEELKTLMEPSINLEDK